MAPPSAAEFLFPLTYICGDIFTEIYGYGASRRAIWLGFFTMPLLAIVGQMAVTLPPAPEWRGKEAYASVFGFVARFAGASLVAYWAGEFTNSYTQAKLKLLTDGGWLWTRTVGSPLTGQPVDTLVVVVVAFAATQPLPMILRMVLSAYMIKVAIEVVATPITDFDVSRLKAAEGADFYDRHTTSAPLPCSERTSGPLNRPVPNASMQGGRVQVFTPAPPSLPGHSPPDFACRQIFCDNDLVPNVRLMGSGLQSFLL